MTAGQQPLRRPGEPLVALLAIAIAWIGVRALAWQSPFAPVAGGTRGGAIAGAPPGERTAAEASPPLVDRRPVPRSLAVFAAKATVERSPPRLVGGHSRFVAPSLAGAAGAPSLPIVTGTPLARLLEALPPAPPRAPSALSPSVRRWRVDSWVAWRAGGAAPPAGQGAALAYGASQAGALFRFDLTRSARRPQAYVRALHAPGRFRQTDLATGLGVRPLARVPLRLQAEARATASQDDVRLRPAVLAVSEFDPIGLPLGLRGEGYAQAGWVGGRQATAFVDGQARLDRQVVAAGGGTLRLGAGAWGGVQRAVGRLDIGPTATLDLRGGGIPARLSVDYRHRVLGSARPGSGIAVTLSTGF